MGRKMMFASSAKAERELGLQVKSVEGALLSACAWFYKNGYVKKARVRCTGC
jgi:dihydroflavonol-4-reductase